jgi:hypothetical protein
MARAMYEIGIRGRLGPSLARAIDGFDVISSNKDETRLRGWVVDQACLYGLLDTISSLGLELLAVSKLAPPRLSPAPPAPG